MILKKILVYSDIPSITHLSCIYDFICSAYMRAVHLTLSFFSQNSLIVHVHSARIRKYLLFNIESTFYKACFLSLYLELCLYTRVFFFYFLKILPYKRIFLAQKRRTNQFFLAFHSPRTHHRFKH